MPKLTSPTAAAAAAARPTLAARVRAACLPLLTDRYEPAARLAARAYQEARSAALRARSGECFPADHWLWVSPAEVEAAERRLAEAEAAAVAALRRSPRQRRVAELLARDRPQLLAAVEVALARADLNPHGAARALDLEAATLRACPPPAPAR